MVYISIANFYLAIFLLLNQHLWVSVHVFLVIFFKTNVRWCLVIVAIQLKMFLVVFYYVCNSVKSWKWFTHF